MRWSATCASCPVTSPAGTRWLYSTGETNLVGILVSQATKSRWPTTWQKKWQPAGMEHQATWLLSKTGKEISGCCIQAATRDFARFGQFILNGAQVNGQSIVPDGWLQEATTRRTTINQPGRGYGYQWWTYDDGTFAARGIFGQGIFIDPQRKIVIASNANWAGGARDPLPAMRVRPSTRPCKSGGRRSRRRTGALRALQVEPCAAPRPRRLQSRHARPSSPLCCWLWPQPLSSPKIPVKMPLKAIQ